MRVLLDTNVLVSALTTRGLCREVLERVLGEDELLICDPVLTELRRVLARKFQLPQPLIRSFVGVLAEEGSWTEPGGPPPLSIDDADDVPILACMIGGKADVLVTGDKELLDLGRVAGIPLVSPRRFWLAVSAERLRD